MSIAIVSVCVPDSVMSSRRTVLKPGSENDSVYTPARRSVIRYWPESSVTAVRTFSMSAGLAASTVTPGSTPPDASRTVPVSDACANADTGSSSRNATIARCLAVLRMNNFSLNRRTTHDARQVTAPPPHVR
jgi:hypothetical protein